MMLMMIALPFVVDSDLKKNIIYVQFSGLLADFLITIFISLTTDLCQDIKMIYSIMVGAIMEHSFKGIAPLRHWYITINGDSSTI